MRNDSDEALLHKLGRRNQFAVGIGVVVLAFGLGFGAIDIPSEAGYGGVGPNFLPWLVAVGLLVCAGFMLYEAATGGFRDMDDAPGDEKPYWIGFVWMSAGLLINAALITTIGFVFSCTLCFVFAARGLRGAQGGGEHGLQSWLKDCMLGLLIAAPVFWLFTQFLAINLPGLTRSGWL